MAKKVKRIKCEELGCPVADMSVKKYGDKYYCPKHAPKRGGSRLLTGKTKKRA